MQNQYADVYPHHVIQTKIVQMASVVMETHVTHPVEGKNQRSLHNLLFSQVAVFHSYKLFKS